MNKIFLSLCLCIFFTNIAICQENRLIKIDSSSSKDIYVFKFTGANKKSVKLPAQGLYGPLYHLNNDREGNIGLSDYFLLDLNSKLQVGKQYKLTFRVKVGQAYFLDSFFRNNFGLAILHSMKLGNPIGG